MLKGINNDCKYIWFTVCFFCCFAVEMFFYPVLFEYCAIYANWLFEPREQQKHNHNTHFSNRVVHEQKLKCLTSIVWFGLNLSKKQHQQQQQHWRKWHCWIRIERASNWDDCLWIIYIISVYMHAYCIFMSTLNVCAMEMTH